MSKDISCIERAIGEKAGFIIFGLARATAGFAFAFAKGWLASLLFLVGFPIMAGIAFSIWKVQAGGFEDYLKAYGQSAGYAEQAISAIKVVHSYGQEIMETQNYNKYLNQARQVGLKQALYQAIGISALFGTMYLYYSYSFFIGRWLVLSPNIKNYND